MKSSRDDLYHLRWYGQIFSNLTEKEDQYHPAGIRPAWECISVNGISSLEFIPRVEELIGYLPESKCFKTYGEDDKCWILFKTEEDALAFKLTFDGEGEFSE